MWVCVYICDWITLLYTRNTVNWLYFNFFFKELRFLRDSQFYTGWSKKAEKRLTKGFMPYQGHNGKLWRWYLVEQKAAVKTAKVSTSHTLCLPSPSAASPDSGYRSPASAQPHSPVPLPHLYTLPWPTSWSANASLRPFPLTSARHNTVLTNKWRYVEWVI